MTYLANYLVKNSFRVAVSVVPLLIALGHASGFMPIGALQKLDNSIYDAKLRWSMPQTRDSRIVIVDIDEKSMSEVGRWPWNRQKLAQLTNELVQTHKVALIGFDAVFAQPDYSGSVAFFKQLSKDQTKLDALFLSQLADMQPSLDYDSQFALALKDQKIALGYYFSNDKTARESGQLPNSIKNYNTSESNSWSLSDLKLEWRGFTSNLELLANAAPLAGFLNTTADDDGVMRSSALLSTYKTNTYESLALALHRVNADLSKGVGNEAEKVSISFEKMAKFLIPYRGLGGPNGGSFQYISAVDVLTKKIPALELRGKIVLIGSSSTGFQDLHMTPVGKDYPSVEIQASVLSGLIDARLLSKPEYAFVIDATVLIFAGLLLSLILPALSISKAFTLGVAVFAIPLALNIYLFHAFNMALPIAALLVLTVVVYLFNMAYSHFVENRTRQGLTHLLSSYVPHQLVDKLLQDPNSHTLMASNKDMTVMFCDLRGFTQLGQDIPPTKLQHLLNDVFSRLSNIILQRQGTVDKYMGDCIMAFWGAPDSLPNHAELAVLAALDIVAEVKKINTNHEAKFLPLVRLGIGINTGVMCVGDMGSSVRRSYTVVGDAVNTASRFESLTKNYKIDILAGMPTKIAAPMFDWVLMDTVLLAGKANLLAIYTINNHSKVLK